MDINEKLTEILKARRGADPQSSYVAALYSKGLNKILEKIGEESTEVILAAKDADPAGDNPELINEVADLWFHCLVMLVHLGEEPAAVLKTLEDRFGVSGIEEKRNRDA